jgi:hypothetical protein
VGHIADGQFNDLARNELGCSGFSHAAKSSWRAPPRPWLLAWAR